MSTRTLPLYPASHRRPGRPVPQSFWRRLAEMWRARATRRLLLEMDQRMLADIGIGRGDALHESGRPFWDLDQRR